MNHLINDKNILKTNKDLVYGWIDDNANCSCLELGNMKKVAIIKYNLLTKKHFISRDSFLEFSEHIFNTKFDSIDEAKSVCFIGVKAWISAIKKEVIF